MPDKLTILFDRFAKLTFCPDQVYVTKQCLALFLQANNLVNSSEYLKDSLRHQTDGDYQ